MALRQIKTLIRNNIPKQPQNAELYFEVAWVYKQEESFLLPAYIPH